MLWPPVLEILTWKLWFIKNAHLKKKAHLFGFTILIHQRRQWRPTPVLLPGKSHDGGAW